MALPTRLLSLSLRAEIEFPEALQVAATRGDYFPAGPRQEGDEELHRFDRSLIAASPDGPRCRRPLSPPLASYRRSTPSSAESKDPAEGEIPDEGGPPADGHRVSGARLEAGAWLFAQWRPADGRELAEGIEWFAREAWWEGRELEGEPYLRLVREDGKLAFQLFWRLALRPRQGTKTEGRG